MRYFPKLKYLITFVFDMFQINQSNLHLLLPGKISWLVEYLPEIPGEGPDYAERKRRYLAWRYRHAVPVLLSIGLGDEIEAPLTEACKSSLWVS